MKNKLLLVTLVGSLTLALAACSEEPKEEPKDETPVQNTQVGDDTNQEIIQQEETGGKFEDKEKEDEADVVIEIPELTDENMEEDTDIQHLTLEDLSANAELSSFVQDINVQISSSADAISSYKVTETNTYIVVAKGSQDTSNNGVKILDVIQEDGMLMVTYEYTDNPEDKFDAIVLDEKVEGTVLVYAIN